MPKTFPDIVDLIPKRPLESFEYSKLLFVITIDFDIRFSGAARAVIPQQKKKKNNDSNHYAPPIN
jgi:hypothetical protein